MSFSKIKLYLQWRLLLLLLCSPSFSLGLTQDGILLLSFKHSVLKDPLSVLSDWNSDDDSPCSWNGVMCTGFPAIAGKNSSVLNWQDNPPSSSVSRVISLVLPGAQLFGSISDELCKIEHLRHLDLSGNVLNGTLPPALFNASELRLLSLDDNEISGELSELFGRLQSLQVLNLSDNAFMGGIPKNLTFLPNLTTVSLSNNYLSGELPGGGFKKVGFLDLGSNLLNGSLPPDLAGDNLRLLNLSYNRFSGELPAKLGFNLTLDLSFNNFSGEIPLSEAFMTQKVSAFVGNPNLCGKPLKILCTIPSTLSNPPNNTSPAAKSPPAFAAMPKTPRGDFPGKAAGAGETSHSSAGLKPATIAAIAIGDLAGLGLLLIIILFFHHSRKKQDKSREPKAVKSVQRTPETEQKRKSSNLSLCLRKNDGNETEETSESSISSETEPDESAGKQPKSAGKDDGNGKEIALEKNQGGILVSVDGETELEVETLLKASAYILGATGASIVYKAVLADGTTFAVRRIGESSNFEKFRDFEAQVRAIAKLRHPNVLPLRCFYWGADERLLIHHYASNGSLANVFFSKKLGSSPFHLSWESRLRIARGVARGLAYLHDKKFLHGNLKPSNILLSSDLEPMIGDLGIDRLVPADTNDTAPAKPGASSRQFGSKRSTLSHGSLPDLSSSSTPTAAASPVSAPPPYQAPESLKSLKPSSKWDVYAFGMVLLELISGRVWLEVEIMQWNAVEEKNRVLRMVDPALREEVEGKEEALLSFFKLGFACAAMAPQRRPSMRDVLLVLERSVSSS